MIAVTFCVDSIFIFFQKKRKKEETSTSSSSSDVDEDLVRESAVDPSWVIEKKGAYPDDRQRTAPIEVIAINKSA